MFAVIFICGNLFLWIAGKNIAKIAKIGTHKNFVIHAFCLRDLIKRIIFSKDV